MMKRIFTNAGTEKVAEIINQSLAPRLINQFPSFHNNKKIYPVFLLKFQR